MAKTTEPVTTEPDVTESAAAQTTESDPAEWVVAKVDLFLGHVRAVSAGDRVHVDTVKNNGWDELVDPA